MVTGSKRSNCLFWSLGTVIHIFGQFVIKKANEDPIKSFPASKLDRNEKKMKIIGTLRNAVKSGSF